MSLVSPNLDDRTWDQLLEVAKDRIRHACPQWTDLTPHEPGMVLLEAFAYLTEAMIYRINRVPDKMYVEFLRLLGVELQPPKAATVELRFRREGASDDPLPIARGTRVTMKRTPGLSEPPVFSTLEDAVLDPKKTHVDVLAIHAHLVQGELVGHGNGLPGQSLRVGRPPIVGPVEADSRNLVVGVATDMSQEAQDEELLAWGGGHFQRWKEVDRFFDQQEDERVFLVDRASGTITFAPAVQLMGSDGLQQKRDLADVPEKGREIRIWYSRGGGPEGNIAKETLTELKTKGSGLTVTNPANAAGGGAAESLENALKRGPLEFRGRHRAVTALDYELSARDSRAINRAKAFTKLEEWRHATPGTVQVLLVPELPDEVEQGDPVDTARLRAGASENAIESVRQVLEQRRPLGTICEVSWTNYKAVTVEARIIIQSGLDSAGLRKRILKRLHGAICPVHFPGKRPGWRFGQTLHISHIYEMCLKEPGVQLVDDVRLTQEHRPTEKLTTVAADHFQEDTWYVGSGNRVFRSQNNGDGWEFLAEFGGEQAEEILKIRAHPERAGHLVLLAKAADNYPIHVSTDCGTTWSNVWNPDFQVSDIAWTNHRDGRPYLLLATEKGLFEVFEGRPRIIPIDITKEEMPLYAVAVDIDPKGGSSVAVALRENGGTYLSREDGKSDTFKLIGGEREDTRVLAFHRRGSQLSLWSGATAIGEDRGTGCNLWELGEKKDSPIVGRTALNEGWDYGGCLGFVFAGTRVLAATHGGGIVYIDEAGEKADPAWQKRPRDYGLPRRPEDRFAQLRDIASTRGMLMAITADGIFRGQIRGATVADCSVDRERITLPRTMLFCSGPHQVTVVPEDRASFDDRSEEESP